MMNNNEIMSIPKEKFAFVSRSEGIRDTKLDTEPIGYFKDAWIRFKKNKSSVVAFVIILLLLLFALVVPLASPYTVADRDDYYATVLPKNRLLSGLGFWDGVRARKDTRAGYDYYNAIGVESGMPAIVGEAKRVESDGGVSYHFGVDTYAEVGYIFKNVTREEYQRLIDYQESSGAQLLYPMTYNYNTEYVIGNSGANLWYKLVDDSKETTGEALYDEEGGYQHNYLTTENYKEAGAAIMRDYRGSRIEGDDGSFVYAVVNQSGYKVRLNYYQYYIYLNGHEPSFLFGTNAYGQDILTCLASGARLSLLLAVVVSAINLTIGAIYGAIEGYYGGTVDIIMERISDILSSVPFMVVATLFQLHLAKRVGVVPSLLFAFVLTGWIAMASRVRMQFYRYKNQEYVLAARTLGASDGRIMLKHIFPNALGTIITGSVLAIPGVIFTESMLSFLGIVNLEASSTVTSIGTMLSQGNTYLTTFPHVLVFPAAFISLLEISFNLFGNGLRDAFNPSLRGSEE